VEDLGATGKQSDRGLGAPVGNPNEVIGTSVRQSDSKVTGFSILQAESERSLTDLLKQHPHHHAPGASIEVPEMMAMPGM
jgi:hypothetical protein